MELVEIHKLWQFRCHGVQCVRCYRSQMRAPDEKRAAAGSPPVSTGGISPFPAIGHGAG
jgi:hypothetical protein